MDTDYLAYILGSATSQVGINWGWQQEHFTYWFIMRIECGQCRQNVLAWSLAHIIGHLININSDYYYCFPFKWEDLIQPSIRRFMDSCLRPTISYRWVQVKTVAIVSYCNILEVTLYLKSKQRMEALPVGKYYKRHFPRIRYCGHVNTNHWHANTPQKYLWWNFSTNPNSLNRVKLNHKLFPRTL